VKQAPHTLRALGGLVETVQRNWDFSDARHAGDLSLCVALLKMREFYCPEHELPLTRALPRSEVDGWMQRREQLWSGLESHAYDPLPLASGTWDPLDSAVQ
jgi:hypothetical protein